MKVICLGPWTGPALSTWLGLETVVTGSRAHSITVAVPDQAQVDNTALFLQSNGEPEVNILSLCIACCKGCAAVSPAGRHSVRVRRCGPGGRPAACSA